MNRDTALLSVSRLSRSFALLCLSITAPYFLISKDLGAIETGMVLFLSSLSSTLAIYFYPRLNIGNRKIAILYGFIFLFSVLFILLYQSIVGFVAGLLIGSISLSGKDMTPNQALEQSSIGSSTKNQKEKNSSFTLYNFMAYTGNMIGALFVFFETQVDFSLIFSVSAVAIAISIVPYIFVRFNEPLKRPVEIVLDEKTKKLTGQLSTLFAFDSFAGGLVSTSILSLWFNIVYSTSLQENGLIFFVVSLITAVSILYSGSISTRMGLVRTMVYTHFVSNLFLIAMPIVHSLFFSEMFLFTRQATSQMDVTPRDSFINTVIDSEKRTKTNSIFLASRNVALVPSPAVAGFLLEWIPPTLLYSAGLIKASYDIVFYLRFRKYKM